MIAFGQKGQTDFLGIKIAHTTNFHLPTKSLPAHGGSEDGQEHRSAHVTGTACQAFGPACEGQRNIT
jgi:hypothetical protein